MNYILNYFLSISVFCKKDIHFICKKRLFNINYMCKSYLYNLLNSNKIIRLKEEAFKCT